MVRNGHSFANDRLGDNRCSLPDFTADGGVVSDADIALDDCPWVEADVMRDADTACDTTPSFDQAVVGDGSEALDHGTSAESGAYADDDVRANLYLVV